MLRLTRSETDNGTDIDTARYVISTTKTVHNNVPFVTMVLRAPRNAAFRCVTIAIAPTTKKMPATRVVKGSIIPLKSQSIATYACTHTFKKNTTKPVEQAMMEIVITNGLR